MKNIVLTVLFLVFSLTVSIAQCPMCKAVAMSAEKEGGHRFGLNDGIMYLLGLPFLCLTIIGVVWYKKSLKFKASVK